MSCQWASENVCLSVCLSVLRWNLISHPDNIGRTDVIYVMWRPNGFPIAIPFTYEVNSIKRGWFVWHGYIIMGPNPQPQLWSVLILYFRGRRLSINRNISIFNNGFAFNVNLARNYFPKRNEKNHVFSKHFNYHYMKYVNDYVWNPCLLTLQLRPVAHDLNKRYPQQSMSHGL